MGALGRWCVALVCVACEPSIDRGVGSDGADDPCAAAPDEIVQQSACSLAIVCPTSSRYGAGGSCEGPLESGEAYSSDELCVLRHLASGSPGRVVLEHACDDVREIMTIDVVASREVMLSVESREPCEECGCAGGESSWGPLDSCALVDLDLFQACLDADDAAQRVACMTPETWIASCEPATPRCVGR